MHMLNAVDVYFNLSLKPLFLGLKSNLFPNLISECVWTKYYLFVGLFVRGRCSSITDWGRFLIRCPNKPNCEDKHLTHFC